MEMEWGVSWVQRTSADECKFWGQKFKAGLVILHLTPAYINDAVAPASLEPFIQASFIREMPSFGLMIRQHAQDMIRINQRVRVVCGAQCGLVGRIFDIDSDQVTVLPEDDTPDLLVLLRSLEPVYRASDKVKSWWLDSYGLVTLVDEKNNQLTYAESGSCRPVSNIFLSYVCTFNAF